MLILAKKVNKKYYRHKASDGFTLIELLVSISIIVTMTTFFLVNYHSTNIRTELILSAQKLASDIRIAQNKSLGSAEYGDDNIPAGGWGVHIEEGVDNYVIFADNDGDFTFDIGEDIINNGAEKLIFPANISIATTTVNGADVTSIDFVFLPPNPVTYINGLDDATAMVILEESISFSTSTIEVNYFGLIDNY